MQTSKTLCGRFTTRWFYRKKQALKGAKIKPYVWWRYLDDIFMIWTGNEDELREFIEYLNNLHRTIKFTLEQSS